MQSINVYFTDKEMKALQNIKKKYNVNWHRFIITGANALQKTRIEREVKNGKTN